MRSFSLTWTSEIDDNEAVVFVSTVHEALKVAWQQLPSRGSLVTPPQIRPFGDWFLQGVAPETDYASFRWYQEQAVDHELGGIDARRFLQVVAHEPWQAETPHYDLSLLHQPLLASSGEVVLGEAVRGVAAVLSVHSLHALTDSWRRLTLLRRLAAHYVGQVLAVPIYETRKGAHCTNLCAMRPAKTLPMLIAYAEQETRAEVLYCEQCQQELGRRLADMHFGVN
jgi:predicted Zn-dependent protease